jgi:hypothetical protein
MFERVSRNDTTILGCYRAKMVVVVLMERYGHGAAGQETSRAGCWTIPRMWWIRVTWLR